MEQGIAAINYGADAVYIGPQNYGARAAVGNSIETISKLCKFAHQFNSKVYATVNTIFYDNEIKQVQQLLDNLAEIEIDAIIIQDLGILKLQTYNIPLFASTQMHNYQIDRMKFLEQLGISRFILARELSLKKIEEIRREVQTELEVFIFGALCVSFSGQCYASFASTGRSANRGECSQICRHKFDLLDSSNSKILSDSYLLSLKDLNLEKYISNLIDLGIDSFKIEGRLKDINYVKNATAYFRKLIDTEINSKSGFRKSSSGKVQILFEPDLNKTFNRGFSDYFIEKRKQNLTSFSSPKHIGEKLGKISKIGKDFYILDSNSKLSVGDGMTFFDSKNELDGFNINRIEGNKIYPNLMKTISIGNTLYRNFDYQFETLLKNDKSKRAILVIIEIEKNNDDFCFKAIDEDGNFAEYFEVNHFEIARNQINARENFEKQFQKTGKTIFEIDRINIKLDSLPFISISELNNIRNILLEKLLNLRCENYNLIRRELTFSIPEYFEKKVNYKSNIANKLSKKLYEEAKVSSIEEAFEKKSDFKNKVVMTTKYCIKYEIGICPVFQKEFMNEKELQLSKKQLYLKDNRHNYKLEFDCTNCEMNIIY